MIKPIKEYDCVVIGGGIFGLYAASQLTQKGAKVVVVEKNKEIFSRASKVNQSRVHRGYHYPRSFATAQKVASYYNRFCRDFEFALINPFKQYYAIATNDSKTSVNEYIHFCRKLNLPLKEVNYSQFFRRGRVTAAFEADESCFDYGKIKKYFLDKSEANKNVHIYYETYPIGYKILSSKYVLSLAGAITKMAAPLVVNATYNNINSVNKTFRFPCYKIKYELCQLKIVKMKNGFSNMGLTVMDGPFFSLMPYADGKIFTLSSVNFTPISTSYREISNIKNRCRDHLKDNKMESLARSYLNPDIDFRYNNSIFEIKPILISSEEDDSRPTLIKIHSRNPFFVSVLAGKISTIYDLDKKLNLVTKLMEV